MRHGFREILAISALFVPASAQAHPGPHRGELPRTPSCKRIISRRLASGRRSPSPPSGR